MYRIRENKMFDARWLKRDGTWGTRTEAAKFSTQNAAEKFAQKHGIETYGIF